MNLKDEEIVELFFDVTKLNRIYSEARFGNLELYRGQYGCLFALESVGTISQKDLANLLHIRPTSVSEILVKLEQKGMINRTPSEKDKRVTLVSLTDKGLEEAKKSRKQRAVRHSEMLHDLTEDEKKSFYNALKKIKNHYIFLEEQENE